MQAASISELMRVWESLPTPKREACATYKARVTDQLLAKMESVRRLIRRGTKWGQFATDKKIL
jgi:hypothetical protein